MRGRGGIAIPVENVKEGRWIKKPIYSRKDCKRPTLRIEMEISKRL